MSALEIRNLSKSFGGVRALNGVSLDIEADSVTGVVGPNGSGKTTLFNVVAGALRPTGGSVRWLGEDVSGWPPHRIARRGLVRSFQQAMSFPALPVRENVAIAAEHGAACKENARSISDLLSFVGLEGLENEIAGSLPFGNLRRLGLALALAARPKLLLLDEPAAGLNDRETEALAEVVASLPGLGVGVCLIDHDMNLMSAICQRLIVLDFGAKIAEGTPDEALNDPKVLEVYLGTPA
jgi:branched-chain amino acid transport system ATP-binding protein